MAYQEEALALLRYAAETGIEYYLHALLARPMENAFGFGQLLTSPDARHILH